MTHVRPRVLLAIPRYRGTNHAIFLGIASLAASLKRSGADVFVLDEDVAVVAEQFDQMPVEETIRRVVSDFAPTLMGVHVNTPNYAAALQLARSLRSQSDAPIVAGGPHATVAASQILTRHPEINFVLSGEADLSLPMLAWAVSNGQSVHDVPGLWRLENGAVVSQRRQALLPVGDFPFPDRRVMLEPPDRFLRKHARSRYQVNFYSSIPGFAGCQVASAYTSRGCNAGCPFCSPSVFWSDPLSHRPVRRVRPVMDVLRELKTVQDLEYGAVFFDEPTFPLGAESSWITAFCAGMRQLGMLWGCATRLDEIEESMIPQLAASGLRYLYFGLETPHADLLRRLNKPAPLDEVMRKLTMLESHGVQCDVSIFFGAPGENDETIGETLAWMSQHLPRGNAFFSTAAIWPGTAWAQNFGLDAECWEPDFDHVDASVHGVVWYSENETAIDRFYSNSTGTYHPAFMSVERALAIKNEVISSGFRDRFRRFSRTQPNYKPSEPL